MILPVFGISTSVPSDYAEIIRRLRMLGIAPTGNPEIDRAKLQNALKNLQEKFELEKKEEKQTEEENRLRRLEEEKLGAQALSVQNRVFFGI